MTRQTTAIGEPDNRDLSELPPATLDARDVAYRAHHKDRSPWWYASDDAGRFNLEIHTCVPYRVPRLWAAAIQRHGFDGIRYLPRFSTGADDIGFALFGAAGRHNHARDPAPRSFASAATDIGIKVMRPPRKATIIDPPTA